MIEHDDTSMSDIEDPSELPPARTDYAVSFTSNQRLPDSVAVYRDFNDTGLYPASVQKNSAIYPKLLIKKGIMYEYYILDQFDVTIGRSSCCTITINDQTLSSYHFLISVHGLHCFLKDLNSKNGTFINDIPVRKSQLLKTGDKITTGKTSFIFINKDEAIPGEQLTIIDEKRKSGKSRFYLTLLLTSILVFYIFITMTGMVSAPENKSHIAYLEKIYANFFNLSRINRNPGAASDTNRSSGDTQFDLQKKRIKADSLHLAEPLSLYAQGYAGLAIYKLSKTEKKNEKSRDLIKKIQQVNDLFEKGLTDYKQKRFEAAFQKWKKAMLVDRDIIGNKGGYYASRIGANIAGEFCRHAHQSYTRSDYSEAAIYCQLALKAFPGYEPANDMLARITDQTNGLNGKKRKIEW